MLKIRRKLTGTFARNTSLRTENALPSYVKGSRDKVRKLMRKTHKLMHYFIHSMRMYKQTIS